MPEPRILSIGESFMTLTCTMASLPQKLQKIESNGEYYYLPSGRGASLSLAGALLGADSVVATRTGEDYYGVRLAKLLKENGVDTRFITTDKRCETAFSLVLHEGDGADREIVYRGVADRFCEEDIESAFLSMPDICVISSESQRGLVRYTASLCEKKNIPLVYLASEDDKDISVDRSSKIDFFYGNAKTVQTLTGVAARSQESCQRACMAITNSYNAKYVIISLDNGVFFFDGKYSSFVECSSPSAIDEEMADEVFVSAFAKEYIATSNVEKAVKFAAYAKALTSQKKGGIESLPNLGEVERFIKETEVRTV